MAALAAHLFRPFQHPAADSCCTVLCTKCHLSYYKFAAEYSADPEGLRTKTESRQGHLGNAKRELPQSSQREAFPRTPGLRVGRGQLRSLTAVMAAGASPRPA